MKRILIRIDDICPTMDFYQFQLAMDLMDKYNIKPLLGVIPDCHDPDLQIEKKHENFWEFVKELQNKGYTIAMHGYIHMFDNHARGIMVKRWDTEFAGHPYEVQLEKIQKGKRILEEHGINTNIFFAPGHSYDENTLKALASCGFMYMSDGLSIKPYKLHNIICIPIQPSGLPRLTHRINNVEILHVHEWKYKEKQYCYNRFIDLIEQHHNEILPWDEYINMPMGNVYWQRMLEKINVFFDRHLKPYLSNIRSRVKK